MFKKYHIPTRQAANRFVEPARSGIIDWSSGCIGCLVCVKKLCPHQAYDQRGVDPMTLQDNLDLTCQDCFRCVQSCPQRLIQKSSNPEFQALGDSYWTPEIISATWTQAQNGKIPVSGAGYGGPFSGEGFDSMWTDMSEIVRPTRDGIHGREYISTSIQLGRRRDHLAFDGEGRLKEPSPPFVELPLPILFRLPQGIDFPPAVGESVKRAAAALATLCLDQGGGALLWAAGEKELADLTRTEPEAVLAVEHRLGQGSPGEVVRLVKAGAGAILLTADHRGRTPEGGFIKDHIRRVHLALVEETLRDRTTLLGSGGIAMAEHVAKAIICGLDGVVIDWPLLLALECRFCPECTPLACPVRIDRVEPEWGAQRIMNLVGAWRDQLLEVMGAMGMREVRRLRGEVGRAMFLEDLEAEVMAPLFGGAAVGGTG
jgi:ferredoxin